MSGNISIFKLPSMIRKYSSLRGKISCSISRAEMVTSTHVYPCRAVICSESVRFNLSCNPFPGIHFDLSVSSNAAWQSAEVSKPGTYQYHQAETEHGGGESLPSEHDSGINGSFPPGCLCSVCFQLRVP